MAIYFYWKEFLYILQFHEKKKKLILVYYRGRKGHEKPKVSIQYTIIIPCSFINGYMHIHVHILVCFSAK